MRRERERERERERTVFPHEGDAPSRPVIIGGSGGQGPAEMPGAG